MNQNADSSELKISALKNENQPEKSKEKEYKNVHQIVPTAEEVLKRIKDIKSSGIVVVGSDGLPILSTCSVELSDPLRLYGVQLALASQAGIKDIDPLNQLQYIRVASKNRHFVIVPSDKYFICATLGSDTEYEQKLY